MSTITFSPAIIAEVIAAHIGKRASLEVLKDTANTHGAAGLEALGEAIRAGFAEKFAHIVSAFGKGDSFAYMQKAKVPGVSTFYTYWCAILKLQRKFEAGNLDAGIELQGMTTGKLTSGKGKAGAKTATKPAAQSTPEPLSVDAAVAFLQAAHKAGALSPLHYAALQALTMAPAPSNVINMGEAVIAEPARLVA